MFTTILSLLGVFLQMYREWRSNKAVFEKSFYEFLKNYSENNAADKEKWQNIVARLRDKTK